MYNVPNIIVDLWVNFCCVDLACLDVQLIEGLQVELPYHALKDDNSQETCIQNNKNTQMYDGLFANNN